jgi:hypothetical protein
MCGLGVDGHDAIARLLGKPGDHVQRRPRCAMSTAWAIIAPGAMTGACALLHLHSSHEWSTGFPLL